MNTLEELQEGPFSDVDSPWHVERMRLEEVALRAMADLLAHTGAAGPFARQHPRGRRNQVGAAGIGFGPAKGGRVAHLLEPSSCCTTVQ